jgi:putative transposase
MSRSGYYAWCHRLPSRRQREDDRLEERIKQIHAKSRCTYGAPRIHAELRATGIRVGRKRVVRLLHQAGLEGCHRRRRRQLTRSDPQRFPADDLVNRQFQATAPNQLWMADLTYISTSEGWLYLAVIIDAYSRYVVGWSMADHMRSELVLDALNLALWRRQPGFGMIHHSDRGSQYTSLIVGERLREAGIMSSMGSAGDCYDNALVESFFATLKTELVHRHRWRTRNQASSAIFDYIERWYNQQRRHSALQYVSPVEYERRCRQERAA